MRHSIRLRLILIVSFMMIMAIASIFIANIFLLPEFYSADKINSMSDVYDEVSSICKDVDWDEVTDEEKGRIYDQLDSISDKRSVSIYIVQISASDEGNIANINYSYPAFTPRLREVTQGMLAKYVRSMYLGEELGDSCEELKKSDQYAVYKVYDTRVDSNYIELTGHLPDGYWLYLRANYTGVTENANVSNRFLIYVGIVVTIISIILIFVIANRYTRPILKLARR